jgi:hypothetical protein
MEGKGGLGMAWGGGGCLDVGIEGGVGWSWSVMLIVIRRAGCCPWTLGVSRYDRVAMTTESSSLLSFELAINGVGELADRWQWAGGGSAWWRWVVMGALLWGLTGGGDRLVVGAVG